MSVKWKLLGVRFPGKNASDNTLGRCTFAFVPHELEPVKINDTYVPKDKSGKPKLRENGGKDYREVVAFEIEGATRVTVKDAWIKVSRNGEAYIQTDIDLSWELKLEIAAAAVAEIDRIEKARGAKSRSTREDSEHQEVA